MNIIPLPDNRKEELFDLLRLSLGEHQTRKRDQAFWDWKHEQNPFGKSISYVAEEKGEIFGLRTFLRWCWLADGKSCQVIRAVDTATHPEHQRKGIFAKLTTAVIVYANQEEINFVFNTPNQQSLPGYLKMGWQKVGVLPMYLKVLSTVGMLAGSLKSVLIKKHYAVDVSYVINNTLCEAGAWLAENRAHISALIEADNSLRGDGFTTSRSFDYLMWRYGKHPYVQYHVVTDTQNGELQGIVFCRANSRKGLREVMINDLLLRSSNHQVVERLMNVLTRAVKADYLIAHFGMNSEHLQLIRQCGFREIPRQGLDFTVRSLDREVSPDPFTLENWSLSLGDLEIF